MKTKINKLLGVLVTFVMLGSLTVGLAVPAAAADGSWSSLLIPQAGSLGNYLMAPPGGVAEAEGDVMTIFAASNDTGTLTIQGYNNVSIDWGDVSESYVTNYYPDVYVYNWTAPAEGGEIVIEVNTSTNASAEGNWSSAGASTAEITDNYSGLAMEEDGEFFLAALTDAGPSFLTKATDGTLYVYWNVGEGDQGSNVYKSTDGGRSWTRCGNTTDDLGDVQIIQIVTSTQDAKRLYVASYEWDETTEEFVNKIYRSVDSGATFTEIITPTDETGGALPIYSMAVGFNGSHFIYIATETIEGGDIFILQDVFGGDWESTNFALSFPDRFVTDVFTSPNFATEANPMVGAVSVEEGSSSFVTFSYGGAAWGAVEGDDVLFTENNVATFDDFGNIVPTGVAFPADFDSRRTARDFFLGVTYESLDDGDVFRIIAATPIALEVEEDGFPVTSVAAAGNSGSCKLLAAGRDPLIYHSEDNGDDWNDALKNPPFDENNDLSGLTNKFLVMDSGYNTNGKAWVAVDTAPDADDLLEESGIYQTLDTGVTWTSLSLLNTSIGSVENMTNSPAYASDSTIFVLTSVGDVGAFDSLWKWDGKYWTRVLGIPAGDAEVSMVQCSPNFASDKTVFLADTDDGQIYRATDTGFYFKAQTSKVPEPFDGAMLVLSSTKIVVGTGAFATITANNGTSWDQIGITGAAGPLAGFAVSPDGKSLLAGDSGNKVFLSADTGASWKQIPAGQNLTTGSGMVNVAFDSGYATNNLVYATSAGSNRVYQLNVATGTRWNTIDGMAVQAGDVNDSVLVPGIQMAKDGTLYVMDRSAAGGVPTVADAFQIFDPAGGDSGFVVITAGALTITAAGGATYSYPVAGSVQVVAWTTPNAGSRLTFTATATPAIGTWTRTTGTAAASIVSDPDLDSVITNPSVLSPTGTFLIGDKASSAAAGTSHIVIRSLTGMGRSFFDPLTSGFTTAGGVVANIRGLWYNDAGGSPQIWIAESGSTSATSRVWTYTDKLTVKTVLTSPANNASVGREGNATLIWAAMPTATNYQIQVALDNAFRSNLYDAITGNTAYVAAGMNSGITYYWRVRSAPTNATPPGKAASPWSDTWAFTMGLGAAQWDPFVPAERVVPIPGSYNVPIRPTFMWNPADWATGYEFTLSKAADFSNPIYSFSGATALKITAFVADKDLEYGTDYYWKVTAISATSKSNTAYGSFRTLLQPTTAPPPVTVPPPVNITIPSQPAPITPAWIWAIVIIGAVLVIAVIILIVTTRRVP